MLLKTEARTSSIGAKRSRDTRALFAPDLIKKRFVAAKRTEFQMAERTIELPIRIKGDKAEAALARMRQHLNDLGKPGARDHRRELPHQFGAMQRAMQAMRRWATEAARPALSALGSPLSACR